MTQPQPLSDRHVVILGGGFGGVYTARQLDRLMKRRPELRVTLISRENYLLITPLLFEAGSGVLEPRHTVTPIRVLFKRVRFVLAEVQRVDLEGRIVFVRGSDGREFEVAYDQ